MPAATRMPDPNVGEPVAETRHPCSAPQGAPTDTNRHQPPEDDTMRGHVARKGSRYYAVVYEGFDAFTGKDK